MTNSFGSEEEVMKKFTHTIIALSVLAGLAGCAKGETPVTPDNNGRITLTLTAGKENVETRTAIDANDSKVINWSENDGIIVFDGENNSYDFYLKDGAGTSTGTFEGEVYATSADGYTALYPHLAAECENGKVKGVELSCDQRATAGGFDPLAAVMYAQSTSADGVLVFRSVVGFVKFTTDFECSQIAIVSNNSSNALAGTFDITPGTVPSVSVTSGSSYFEVSLAAASEGNIAPGTYYIALLPGKLADGFKLVFTMPDGSRKYRATANSLEIKSNGVKKLGTIKESDLSDVVYEDLSASATANCYLVTKEGDYKFKAVKGNSETSVGTVASVSVLWETFGTSETPSVGDLIDVASYSDGYIRFSTPATFRNGNAVIAAKDANGTILWSWHIWCSVEGWKEQVYNNNAGTMMDRNLGATSASIPTSADDAGSAGLLYQWGRKDPFIGVSSFTASSGYLTRAASTCTLDNSSTEITAALAIQNPTTLYSGALPDSSWGSTKTIYDPSPAGWRVPDGGENGIWAKASSGKDFSVTQGTYGRNFGGVFGSDTTIWYPAAGYVRKSNGELFSASGNYWSVTPGTESGAYAFVFWPTGTEYYSLYTAQNANRDTARSVRCVKDVKE